jgi:hypothetical protein
MMRGWVQVARGLSTPGRRVRLQPHRRLALGQILLTLGPHRAILPLIHRRYDPGLPGVNWAWVTRGPLEQPKRRSWRALLGVARTCCERLRFEYG